MPVYKVEKHLKTAIDSVLAQTYNNFEIVLVDDASPDNCPNICDEYAEKYENITCIFYLFSVYTYLQSTYWQNQAEEEDS